ncbi:MAG: T9SS type A sorting domain-containing protein [Bacteroidota bacterium]
MKKLLFLLVFVVAGIATQAQWTMQNTHFPLQYTYPLHLCAVDANVVWATGGDGDVNPTYLQDFTRTNNGGTTWTAGHFNGWNTYGTAMIFAIDYNTAWIPLFDSLGVGGGAIIKTTDGGTTWVHQTTAAFAGAAAFPNVIHFWNANEGFCMGDPNGGSFEIYTTIDGGNDWVRTPAANIPAYLSGEFGVVGYYSVVGDNIWFGTNKGRVYKSINKGLNWTVSTVSSTWAAVYVEPKFITATHGVVIHKGNGSGTGSTGEKYETFDGGATWSLINQTGPLYVTDNAWVPGLPNTMVATGSASGNSGIAYSNDGGHNWTDFDDTIGGNQFLYTAWVNGTTGWAGHWTDPSGVGGMRKYLGALTNILNIDPNQGGVEIYPNPSTGNFTCAIVGFGSQDVVITVMNSIGQNVYNNTVNQGYSSYSTHMDLSGLESGLYIARIQSGTKTITKKLTIR